MKTIINENEFKIKIVFRVSPISVLYLKQGKNYFPVHIFALFLRLIRTKVCSRMEKMKYLQTNTFWEHNNVECQF